MATYHYNTKFVVDNRLNPPSALFPIGTRVSCSQRIKKHAINFTIINASASLGYLLIDFLTMNFKYALKQAGKSVIHKGFIGIIFFSQDTNQIVWSWINSIRNQKKLQQYRISSWASLGLSAIILFPAFFFINKSFKLPFRKTLSKTFADSLLLIVLGLQFERQIRWTRSILMQGTEEQKKNKIKFSL